MNICFFIKENENSSVFGAERMSLQKTLSLFKRNIIYIVLWVLAIVYAVVISSNYFAYVSDQSNKTSSENVSEVYSQVALRFDDFLTQNWNNLEDWSHLISSAQNEDKIEDFLSHRKDLWGIDKIYFINDNGQAVTIDGQPANLALDSVAINRIHSDAPAIFECNIGDNNKQEIIFSIPVDTDVYRGFSYNTLSIGVSYDKLVSVLHTQAFSDECSTCIVNNDGKIFVSTNEEVFHVSDNIINSIEEVASLSKNELDGVSNGIANTDDNIIRCDVFNQPSYISYEPIGYLDYSLIGIVPESATNTTLVEIQQATTEVLIKIFAVIFIVLLIQVITKYRSKLKNSNQQTEYRNAMFKVLSSTSDDIEVMFSLNPTHTDYVTPNIERLLGISMDEVLKDIHSLDETLNDKDTIVDTDALSSLKIGETMLLQRYRINQRTKDRRWYHDTIYHLNVSGKDKYIAVLSDRTDEKLMREGLENALTNAENASNAKSIFLSNMSHDIRTPMNGIIGFLELMDKDADDPEKVREYSEKIKVSSEYLLNSVNNILDMSKIESGQEKLTLSEENIDTIINEVIDIVNPQVLAKKQTLSIDVNIDNKELMIDKQHLNTILINVLDNAVKYTPENGRISFSASETKGKKGNKAYIKFVIVDNGQGMTDEFLSNIFEPFAREENSVTNKIKGFGLGLPISKNLIELMGGTINIDSVKNNGTTITIVLPFDKVIDTAAEETKQTDNEKTEKELSLAEEAISNKIEKDTDTQNVFQNKNILIVEDDEINAEILSAVLEQKEAQVSIAADGQIAVDMFEDSEPYTYDMIFMDIQMPNMNGYEATKTIRKTDRPDADLPIFAMTANAFTEDIQNSMNAGMDAHLTKPINIKKISDEVQKVLDEKTNH